jgi:hypothetical protein
VNGDAGSWDLVVEREIGAPPETVWPMIADVTRMGEWSPESGNGQWRDGATGPAVGARFQVLNRNKWHRWSVVSEVVACEPHHLFSFDPLFRGRPYCTWSYQIEAQGEGCVVRESWVDKRGRFLVVLGRIATGVGDRLAHNRLTMAATLDRLAAAAEA